jgi:hypothetical protein
LNVSSSLRPSLSGPGCDVEQTEGERSKRTRQSRENRCSNGSVYFAEDICEAVSMVHWEIDAVTYLRGTSQTSRKGLVIKFRLTPGYFGYYLTFYYRT